MLPYCPLLIMITLDKISKKIAGRVLFEDVSVTFSNGCRYGLTGPNGAGKSTLFKIIVKLEEATSGNVVVPEKIGFLKQNIEDYKNSTVLDTVIMGNVRLWKAFAEREALYEGEMTDAVGLRLGELEEIIGEENGYTAESDAEILLEGIGIERNYYPELMKTIPTDRQFRVLLCQALFGKPKALLLDEPTNHLDLSSIGWLEEFLKNYGGTLIVISHDRHFLNTITTHIADIDYETLIIYPGNYDDMLVVKTSLRERTEMENKAKEKKIAQLKEFVAKFGAGTRASQVQSRVREIQRLQPQELKKSNIQRPYIRFYPPERQPGQVVLKAEEIGKEYVKNHPIIGHFSLEIHRGDKIAVIGNNGQGKTTLLKMLAQKLLPDTGSISLGHQVKIGYFPQSHHDVLDKHSTGTLFDWLKNIRPGIYDNDVRSVLGKLLFTGDDAFKSIAALSGGETARLILASLMLDEPNFLLLDEPNNHLDLEAVSALAWGLEEYKGTAILATHDRELINQFAKKLILFENGKIRVFDGTLDELSKT